MNRQKGKDCLSPRDLVRYPVLHEVRHKYDNLGKVRVRKMDLKSIKEVQDAHPNQELNNGIYTEWFNSRDSAYQSEVGHYLILFMETRIKNIPKMTQTVILVPKQEEEIMLTNKYNTNRFSKKQLEHYREFITDLGDILEEQVVDIDEVILDRCIEKAYDNYISKYTASSTTRTNLCRLIFDLRQTMKVWGYSLDEGLNQELAIEYGYHPYLGTWDGTFEWYENCDNRKSPEGKSLGLRQFTLAQLNALEKFTDTLCEEYKVIGDLGRSLDNVWLRLTQDIPEREVSVTAIDFAFPEVSDLIYDLTKLNNRTLEELKKNIALVGINYGYNPDTDAWDESYDTSKSAK